MKDAISYIRVSSEEQADSGLGLEAQRQRIAAYCALKGLHLAEVFEDPGISASKPLARCLYYLPQSVEMFTRTKRPVTFVTEQRLGARTERSKREYHAP